MAIPCQTSGRAGAMAWHSRAYFRDRGMNYPGVWILGDTSDDDREHGMGVVVEYGSKGGKPRIKPPNLKWDYGQFASPNVTANTPDETIEMTFAKRNAADNGFNLWTINGTSFSWKKCSRCFRFTKANAIACGCATRATTFTGAFAPSRSN